MKKNVKKQLYRQKNSFRCVYVLVYAFMCVIWQIWRGRYQAK